jgi:hypothetical protein
MDTYSHVMPGMQDEAAEKLGAALDAAVQHAQADIGHTLATLTA